MYYCSSIPNSKGQNWPKNGPKTGLKSGQILLNCPPELLVVGVRGHLQLEEGAVAAVVAHGALEEE